MMQALVSKQARLSLILVKEIVDPDKFNPFRECDARATLRIKHSHIVLAQFHTNRHMICVGGRREGKGVSHSLTKIQKITESTTGDFPLELRCDVIRPSR